MSFLLSKNVRVTQFYKNYLLESFCFFTRLAKIV